MSIKTRRYTKRLLQDIKRYKALNKAVKIMETKTVLQCNKIHPLEDTMIMYNVYNSDMLTELIYGYIDNINTFVLLQNYYTLVKQNTRNTIPLFPPDSPCQLHIFGHNCYTLGIYSAQVGIFK